MGLCYPVYIITSISFNNERVDIYKFSLVEVIGPTLLTRSAQYDTLLFIEHCSR